MAVGGEPQIAGKLRAPDLPPGVTLRPRVTELFDDDARVNLLVAPAGYGKTIAVRQWVEATGRPTAWLSVDMLDANPVTFWLHVVAAIRTVAPTVDDEPESALAENPRSRHFLAVLLAQLERLDHEVLLVLDDLGRVEDPAVLDGLALLVDRVGDRVRLAISARSEPQLPSARWRTYGWLVEVRAEDLRFRDEEARAVASETFGASGLRPEAVSQLNRHVDGWPLAFQLAVVSRGGSDTPYEGPGAEGEDDRLIADFLLGEILDRLPPEEQEVALVLSTVDWFDTAVAEALGGPAASAAVAGLRRRHLVRPVASGPPGSLRFQPLLRSLLDDEMRWRDPERHAELHRRAAEQARVRGDLNRAHHHLTTIGDDDAANALVVGPVLDLVDEGDLPGVARIIGSLPATMSVDDPALALDLAISWFFAGSEHHATTWCERAEWLGADEDPTTSLRLHAVRSIVALGAGRLDEAAAQVEGVEALVQHGAGTGPIERRFPAFAARVALSRRDAEGARRWLDRARLFGDPQGRVGSTITGPVLAAWADLLAGRLLDADATVSAACAAIEEMDVRPHHAALDALVVAAWCRLGSGRLAAADDLAGHARVDAALLGWESQRLRAGAVAAETRLLLDGPDAALAVVRDVREQLRGAPFVTTAELDRVAAKALLRAGRRDEAAALLSTLDPSPPVLLVLAAVAIANGSRESVGPLLAGSAGWSLPERLEAIVLRGAVGVEPGHEVLAAALEEAAATGWVSPFLGHGSRVDELLLRQPLERLHPHLLDHLRTARPARSIPVIDLVDPITAREQTILELLPSHLSYAQIGERLFLSVNTVKSNLKSIYRKLGVATRADAVDAARAGGLL